ncbi:ATP-binding protein [Streptomyces sp. NPDC002215]|uniref:sensor histidine kinase n=1 Tax=Streptomyces sp. NPDC002215 TaxID=3154412 RepID=UPI00331DF296
MASLVGRRSGRPCASARTADVHVTTHHAPRTSHLAPAQVAGDPSLLRHIALNLLANAVRHNHPGGTATVATGVHENLAFIEVINTGPVLDRGEVPTLSEPFQRGTKRGSKGMGLGSPWCVRSPSPTMARSPQLPTPAADSRCGSTCLIGPTRAPGKRGWGTGRGFLAPTRAVSGSVVRPRRRWRRSSGSGRGQSGACR